MDNETEALVALIREVRVCFNELKSLAEELHEDSKINASLRAILEALHQKPKQSVPELAAARSVSRQHVQKIVNTLLSRELVVSSDNPAHKKSQLLSLTAAGSQTFLEILEREEAPIKTLAKAMPAEEVKKGLQIIHNFNSNISKVRRVMPNG